MSKLSIIIPSRDEQFLTKTIDDIFRNARADDTEVVAVLDSDKWPGDWKEVTDRHPRLHTIHNGQPIGMRGSINKGVASAKSRGAKYVMKLDGHCMLDEGFDVKLLETIEPNWVVIPRRKRLDADNWTLTDAHKIDIDYHYLSFPDDPKDFGGKGLNGKPWDERSRERRDKPEYDLDDEMASQGSAWLTSIDYFYELELMDEANYGPFWNESQEVLLKCWLSGGRGVINKKTFYAHLHKGSKHGRGYKLPESWLKQGASFTKNWIWNEAWSKQTKPFSWLIEHFWPVPSWPENWEEVLYATRGPRAVGVAVGHSGIIDSDSGGGFRENPTLVIYQANYGLRNYEGDFIDVTQHLQSLVKNNSLDIIVNNSTLTPGQNPFRGKKKQLHLVYSIDGTERVERVVEEKDWLIIGPARGRADTQWGRGQVLRDVGLTGKEAATLIAEQDTRDARLIPDLKIHSREPVIIDGSLGSRSVTIEYPYEPREREPVKMIPKPDFPPQTSAALNDFLIRKFQISPQRLRGPMPIELRDFHRNNLAQLFAELGFKRGAEIGVAEGNYSEVLLKANPDCELLLVDPWHYYSDNPQGKSKEKHEFAYKEMLRKTVNYNNVQIMSGYSMDMVRGVNKGELDFFYCDGNHLFDFVMQDLIEWSKRVRPGGIVSGDDYYALDQKRWVGGGVVEAVQAYVNAHRIPIWWIFQGHKSVDFMWVKP